MVMARNTHVHVFSTVVKFKMVILTFKIEREKKMGKFIDVMECFTGALLNVTIQQKIKCAFN